MQKRRLNGLFMTTKERAHRHVKRRLHLPDYYGCNLDALCDCLSEINEPTDITLRHAAYMRKRLGAYGTRLLSAMLACTGENPKLSVRVRERF